MKPQDEALSVTQELKPCPFCGEPAYLDGSDLNGFHAGCTSCYAEVGEAYDRDALPSHMFPTADAAITAWNTRLSHSTPGDAEVAKGGFACPICDKEGPHHHGHAVTEAWRSTTHKRLVEAAISQAFSDGAYAVAGAYGIDDPQADHVIKQAFHPSDYALATPSGRAQAWLPMTTAPRDRTYILALIGNIAEERWSHLSGRMFVIRHEGQTPSDYDLGWSLHPGFGGIHDSWFVGWQPLPAAPPAQDQKGDEA